MDIEISEPTSQYLPDQIVLLGDSIFDNAPYVNTGESVSEQLTGLIQTEAMKTVSGANSTTTHVELLAVDGHVILNIGRSQPWPCFEIVNPRALDSQQKH